jgi:hypothetical protein
MVNPWNLGRKEKNLSLICIENSALSQDGANEEGQVV